MKIPAINNNYVTNNNRSFNGKFVKTDALKTFVDNASYEDLKRFKGILTKMDEVDDDYLYILEKQVYINETSHDYLFDEDERDYNVDTGFELFQQKGADRTTKKHVAGFEDDGYFMHKLREVCDNMERLYPEKVTKRTKGQLTQQIFDMMI